MKTTAVNPPTPHPIPLKGIAATLLVVLSAAATPIAIRNAQLQGVPSLYIITVRLITISLVLFPLVRRRHWPLLQQLEPHDWQLVTIAGIFFALNLLLLFVSLEYTSVLVNGVTRHTSPLWIICLEIFLLGAIFTWRVWGGLFLALSGSILVALSSSGAVNPGSNPLLGAGLGLLGSFCLSFYMLIGRNLSRKLPSLAYSWVVFTIAALVALLFALIRQTPLWGYSLLGYAWVIVVVIIAQFVGHLAINAGLHYFPATTMSLFMQLSVALSALLAFLTLGEAPSLGQMIGSVLIVAGVLLATRPSR